MQNNLLSTSQVAKLLGVRKHRIEYAVSEGHVPEPKLRFLNKRAFDPDEVCVVAAHFRKNNEPQQDR